MKKLSIVVPCFNEEECIDAFIEAIDGLRLECDREIVFVDDGSTDGTLSRIKAARENDARIGFVSLSRNFGKEAAMLAGLRKASGDIVVTMDADLQDPPSLLPDMLAAVTREGYDCAAARRITRDGEPALRSFLARAFYRLMGLFSEVELADGARDYRLMTRRVADAVVSMPETNRFSKGICQWVGFRTKWIPFRNVARANGESKWSLWRLFAYAVDGMMSFSALPLQWASFAGIAGCAAAFCGIVFVIVRKALYGDPVAGWPSLVCIIVFIGGLQLFFTGVLGCYLAKTYRESKRRPPYIVAEESPGAGIEGN